MQPKGVLRDERLAASLKLKNYIFLFKKVKKLNVLPIHEAWFESIVIVELGDIS